MQQQIQDFGALKSKGNHSWARKKWRIAGMESLLTLIIHTNEDES
jgi:hypothetical protein